MTTKAARLAATVNDLRYATQELLVVADEFVNLLGDDPDFVAALPKPTILHQPQTPTVEAPPSEPPVAIVEQEPKTVTLEEVRAVLAELARAGHHDQVRELIADYNAAKLSKVDPVNYAALLAGAQQLDTGNG